MVLETIEPPGLYFGINICNVKLIKQMEDNHRSLNKGPLIKFYLVPITYFFEKDFYNIIFELKVYYTKDTGYFFTAENILVRFKMTKGFQEYNAR